MAFLVCYVENSQHDDWKDQAMYLHQEFYATIFRQCRRNAVRYPILAEIASLDYDGELTVAVNQCPALISELADLQSALWFRRQQISDLIAVCERAIERKCDLKVGGDMFPVYGQAKFWPNWTPVIRAINGLRPVTSRPKPGRGPRGS
ncbi:MAG: hypothetical protein U0795_00575 [Pirellulales bacterium]